jgi:glutamyl-tRNA reductase
MIVVVGLSHRTAPVEIREKLAIGQDVLGDTLRSWATRPHIGEIMCLSTCNRVEVIACASPRTSSQQPELGQEIAQELIRALNQISLESRGPEVHKFLYQRSGQEAVVHLFRVASSLDSLVVGEPQILGQLKDAFELAQQVGTVGPNLTRVITKAIHTAKRVRSETAIGAGVVSVSSVAVDLACQIFGDLHGRKALLVGAGTMAEEAAHRLHQAGASILVVNRSPDKAHNLAQKFGGIPRPWEGLHASLVEADVVVTSTSSKGYVLSYDLLKSVVKLRRGRSLFLIDIAVPRDIEPSVNGLENVFSYDVDDLESIVLQSLEGRGAEAKKAEHLVADEVAKFEAWVEARGVIPTIVAMRSKTRTTLLAELHRSLQGKLKHLSERDQKILEIMMESAANKLLHAPLTKLKQAASDPRGEEMAHVVRELFELPDVSVVTDSSKVPVSKPSEPPNEPNKKGQL